MRIASIRRPSASLAAKSMEFPDLSRASPRPAKTLKGVALRPVALSRKNALFAGSDEGGANWAAIASLIETCKLNGVDPQAYFTDLLTRLINGWPQARIDDLMPWNFHRHTAH